MSDNLTTPTELEVLKATMRPSLEEYRQHSYVKGHFIDYEAYSHALDRYVAYLEAALLIEQALRTEP